MRFVGFEAICWKWLMPRCSFANDYDSDQFRATEKQCFHLCPDLTLHFV